MEIEQNNIVNSICNLIKQNQIKEAIQYLLQIEQVNQNDLESFLDKQILTPILKFYIKQDEDLERDDKGEHIQEYQNLLTLIDRLFLVDDKRINQIIMKSNVQALMTKFLAIKHPNFSVIVFCILSHLAKQTPELFTTQLIQQLQRSLLEKCSNSSLRLEYFFSIFNNLKEQAPKYKINAYFYINFLKMQFQSIKLTKKSVSYVISTLEFLLKDQENSESSTIKNIFEVVTGCMFQRLSIDYNICNVNFEECDQNIQFEFFSLIQIFMDYCQQSTTEFISKNISEIRNVFTDVRKKKQKLVNLSLVLEIVNEAISYESEESLLIIDNLLSWEKFQKVIDDLTFQNIMQPNNREKDQFLNRKVKQVICDILVNILNKNQDYILDYFINQYLIGQLVDLSTYLDSKRRQIGIESVVKVLKYLKLQQEDKFIIEQDSQDENQSSLQTHRYDENVDYEFCSYKSNKIILNSLPDLFEMTQLPYDANTVIPSYYKEMQKLSNQVRSKIYKKFGSKLPNSLTEQISQFENKKNFKSKNKKLSQQENQDDWEDVSEDNQEIVNNGQE